MATTQTKNQLKILLLDADPEHYLFMFQELTSRGYAVLNAGSVVEAKNVLEKNEISLVILDIELSRSERASFFNLVQVKKQIPILWLISPSLISREGAYAEGASAILSKPIDPELLNTKVRDVIVPTAKKWKRKTKSSSAADAYNATYALEVTLNRLNLGRGGISVQVPKSENSSQMFEGQRIQLKLTVNETQKWSIKGTGILRYIKMDKSSQEPKAWGIEFESLEETTLDRVLKEISKKNPSAYIPSLN